jgi:glycosyltransferase involved in cell wall biosynthesis
MGCLSIGSGGVVALVGEMIGMLRVKNEARWIERVIGAILPLCPRVCVLDDHSTDGTKSLCAALPGVTVFDSPFSDLDETRDKNYLLDRIGANPGEWILSIDGDEILAPSAVAPIRAAVASQALALSLRVRYLWDREDQVRVDGVYGGFRRPSAFRFGSQRFEATAAGGNFHCGNVPLALQARALAIDADLLHLGYLHREDRLRKYEWYNRHDARNGNEDGYRHMVVGDLFPADSAFRWGGPLRLEAC